MGNYKDYLKEFGNKTFSEAPLNEVDALLFSVVSYVKFNKILPKSYLGKGMKLPEIVDALHGLDIDVAGVAKEDQEDLLKCLSEAKRFENTTINSYADVYDKVQEVQFSAICVYFDENSVLLVYRGTDSTIIGWKENLKLSYEDNVEAQISALQYSNFIYSLHPNYNFYIAGHSKGGNLAIFAGLKTNIPKEQIKAIWSFDGPGFSNDEIIKLYEQNVDKIHHIIPEESIVGQLLTSPGKYIAIKSNGKGIMQHSGFTWEIDGDHFYRLKDVNEVSKYIQKVVSKWLMEIDYERREQFSEGIYEFLTSNNEISLGDLKFGGFKGVLKIIGKYNGLPKDTKTILNKTIGELVHSYFQTKKDDNQEKKELKKTEKEEKKIAKKKK